jgi:hypothetical protein
MRNQKKTYVKIGGKHQARDSRVSSVDIMTCTTHSSILCRVKKAVAALGPTQP